MKKNSVRVIPYILSNYLWFLIIVVTMSVLNNTTEKVKMPSRKCNPNNSFNESYNPDYFYHLTDVHVTHDDKSTYEKLRTAYSVGASYKPDLLLNTGDMVDSYNYPIGTKQVRVTKQTPDDWKLYQSATEEFSQNFSKIIECVGNHDVPRVWSLNSEEFCFPKYSQAKKYYNLTEKLENFQMYTAVVGEFTHIIMNPMKFPLAPIPFNYYGRPSKEYLDRLEKEIENADDSKTLIVSSHYQGPVWSDQKSSKGNDFKAIINNKKVSMYLSGHNHGAAHMIMHHNDALEVCGSDLRFNNKAGIVTTDNGMSIFHYVDVYHPPTFFVTYPAPIEQTTSRTKCDIGYPLIRVIAFNRTADIYAKVDDGVNQKLSFEREIKDGVYLFSVRLPDFPKGTHKLTVNNMHESEEFNFIYDADGSTPSGTELLYDDMIWSKYHIYVFGLLYVIALYITFPVNFLLLEQYNEWIKDSSITKNSAINWIISIIGGFLGLRGRIANLHLPVRITLFVSTLLSIFVPIFSFHIEGHLQHAFFFGVLLNGELRYEPWCTFLVFYFFAISVFPTIFACSSIGFLRKADNIFVKVIDCLIYIVCVVANFFIAFVTFSLINDKADGLISGFVSYISVWGIALICYIIYLKKNKKISGYEDNLLKVNTI